MGQQPYSKSLELEVLNECGISENHQLKWSLCSESCDALIHEQWKT